MRGLDPKQYLDSVLDENEKALINLFVENDKMYQAVRKALLAGVYQQGTLKKGKEANSMNNMAFSVVANGGREINNEQIGADLRALWEGVNYVESSLEDLLGYKQNPEEKKVVKNPAR